MAVALALTVMLAACGARVDINVAVARTGSGSVTVEVQLPAGTADAIEDLRKGLPVADLRQAGWAVAGPHAGPSGSTVVAATHAFSTLSQLPTLIADIAGGGAVGGRPFRLTITEQIGALRDSFQAAGTVDLRCDLACFDDPSLAARVGYPLGLPQAAISKLFGNNLATAVRFRFRLSLPGRATSAGLNEAGGSSIWASSPALGGVTRIDASSVNVNVAFLRRLSAAIGAGALVVLFTAAWLFRRQRRRRRPRPSGARSGPAARRGGPRVVVGRR